MDSLRQALSIWAKLELTLSLKEFKTSTEIVNFFSTTSDLRMESAMKQVRLWILILIIGGYFPANLLAQRGQETAFERDLNTRDDQPLREFVESKENIDIKEKASNMEISGDVRFEWRTIREKGVVYFFEDDDYSYGSSSDSLRKEYRNLRGGDHVDFRNVPISNNDFDVEFNFKLKYNYKRAWCYAHLQFDNPCGIRGRNDCFGKYILFNEEGSYVSGDLRRDQRFAYKGSGEANNINLKRAFMGYNIWADGKHRLDIELGRRKFDDVFDSEIEFTSRFDGILLKYASSINEFSDWYANAATFIIDERVNHFGWVFEVGLIDVMDTGFDIRYNIIDWRKGGRNRCGIMDANGTQFLNSQISAAYTIHPKFGCDDTELPIEFYGGFLINHAAEKRIFSRYKSKNLGWYAGIYFGNPHKEGDWALDLEYILVQAQAVADHDVGSIGRGNILDENFNDILDESFPCYSERPSPGSEPSSGIRGIFPRRGNANFVGYRIEFIYLITDNFSIDMIFETSNAEDSRIGGRHSYNDFEIETIYAF